MHITFPAFSSSFFVKVPSPGPISITKLYHIDFYFSIIYNKSVFLCKCGDFYKEKLYK